MSNSRRPLLLLAAAAALVAVPLSAQAISVAGASASPYCGITWGSAPKSAGTLRSAPLVATRAGINRCFDRVVFETNGTAGGYRVSYANAVYSEGQGAKLDAAGGAVLSVALLDPAYDSGGRTTYPHRTGDHVVNAAGFPTLRDVVYGGTFEGQTGFAVGVRARLPFRVFTVPGPESHTRTVVDIANHW